MGCQPAPQAGPERKAAPEKKPEAAAEAPRQQEPSAETSPAPEQSNGDLLPLTSARADSFFAAYAQAHPENKLKVSTPFGNIHIRLYQNTPRHRASMLFLTRQGYFDGTWFYRVRPGHVVQAGNNTLPETQEQRHEIGKYTLAAEKIGENYHHTGAVAMARSYDNNPGKRSTPYEWYISIGQTFTAGQLKAMEKQQDLSLNAEQRRLYQEEGGLPHLDQDHTVIGEVTRGMDVVRQIARQPTDSREWPKEDIPLEVEIVE
jgi:cyclophilin family peptidyl-prolyl cis-trans isomerase